MNVYIFFSQLPQSICSYQDVNYTIIVESSDQHSNTLQLGPYQQYGFDTISRTIASDLNEDREYTLTVEINTIAGVATSQEYPFSKIH